MMLNCLASCYVDLAEEGWVDVLQCGLPDLKIGIGAFSRRRRSAW